MRFWWFDLYGFACRSWRPDLVACGENVCPEAMFYY